jgi:hypothetical protein
MDEEVNVRVRLRGVMGCVVVADEADDREVLRERLDFEVG